jgi:phosphate transport system permease protein
VSAADLSALQRPNDRLRRRRVVNRGMELLAWLAAAVAVAILGIVVWSVAKRGASELNLDLLTKPAGAVGLFPLPGVKQGLANAFAGSLVIVGLATAMALPVGILVAIYVNEFAPRAVRRGVGLTLDVLNGIPAIVIGIFVFGLFVVGHGQSGTAGSFALAVLMLPLVARATIEVLALVPDTLREASLGLGVPRWRTTLGIVLPQTIGGIVTGTVLAVARVAGETAPLLFTSSVGVSSGAAWNPAHALQTVPVAIFELSESPSPDDHARAWAAAFVLLMFILVASLSARWLANRSRRKLGRAAR